MNWTKVTPTTLPPAGEAVIVTVEYSDGERDVLADVKWNQTEHAWEWLAEAVSGYWDTLSPKVTHWAKMPAPADD